MFRLNSGRKVWQLKKRKQKYCCRGKCTKCVGCSPSIKITYIVLTTQYYYSKSLYPWQRRKNYLDPRHALYSQRLSTQVDGCFIRCSRLFYEPPPYFLTFSVQSICFSELHLSLPKIFASVDTTDTATIPSTSKSS